MRMAAFALVLALGGCAERKTAEDGNSAAAAAADKAGGAEMQGRAERALAGQRGGGGRIRESLAPFAISATSLTGKEPFAWGTDSWGVLVVAAHAEEQTPRGTMEFERRSGRMLVNLPQNNGYHYYVECDVQMSQPNMRLRWDAMMNQTGPVNGVATLDPATNRYYFATPAAGTTANGRVYFTIDAQVDPNPADSRWMLKRCDVLPFKAE